MRPFDWERLLKEQRIPYVESGPNVKRGELALYYNLSVRIGGIRKAATHCLPHALMSASGEMAMSERIRVIPEEDWKPIPGYLGLYEVSKCGTVRSLSVLRLVALAWVPNPQRLPLVRHKDDCKDHNHVTNLVWGTAKDNYEDGRQNGRAYRHVLQHAERLALEARVQSAVRSGVIYRGLGRDLAKATKVGEGTISKIKRKVERSLYA